MILVVGFALWFYPVEGVIWSADQVDRLAQVNGELRSETDGQAAIQEALDGLRFDRFRRILHAVTGKPCHSRDLQLLTDSGWIAATVECPSGLFMDFWPPPGLGRP